MMLLTFFLFLVVFWVALTVFFIRQVNRQTNKETLDKKNHYMGPEDEPRWTEYSHHLKN